jgi:hypothetical protein
MTSDVDWDPSHYDKDINELAEFHDPSEDNHENYHFNQYGEYRCHTVATYSIMMRVSFLSLTIKLMI